MSPKRILIVEDDPDVLDAMGGQLQHAGYRVATLDRSHNVPAAVAAHQPDLVILDMLMRPYDGPQVAQQLAYQQVALPLLFVTALDLHTTSIADHAVLTKPFEMQDLLAAVARIIGPPGDRPA